MKTILVIGYNGFIGKNLMEALNRIENINILKYGSKDNLDKLVSYLKKADFIYHIAGVNRPENEDEYEKVNVELTAMITNILEKNNKKTPILFSSTIQAKLNNPYGISKKKAEDILFEYSDQNQVPVYVYRLANVFGKWGKPNYNSVVITFCYNISRDLKITISDKNHKLELIYIDDVIKDFLEKMSQPAVVLEKKYYSIKRKFNITLGKLADMIYKIKESRNTLVVPDFSDDFTRFLYATYLSYLDKDDFSYELDKKTDQRGWLAELIKSKEFGQIFISATNEGFKRGDHYHNTKIEKFCLIQGKAEIKLRNIYTNEVLSYIVSDEKIEIIDIPPGYTHSIENLLDREMIVLFWASEIFNQDKSDTYYCEV